MKTIPGDRCPIEVVGDVKWTALGAAALGFALFQILGAALQLVASGIDGALYTNVGISTREILVRYRAWEIYRALFASISAVYCGWVVARVFPSRHKLAVTSVVVVIGASLLISLFTGPGYYGRDFVMIAAITVSPLIGAWFQRSRLGQPTE